MGRILGLFLIQFMMTAPAYGVSRPHLRPSEAFFRGSEITADDLYKEKSPRLEALSDKVVEAIIAKFGMSVQNAKAHGMGQNEFLYRKARTVVPVKRVDIDIKPRFLGYFSFDIIYSNGTEFFAETEPDRIENCKGHISKDGVVDVNLDGCIAKHYAGF